MLSSGCLFLKPFQQSFDGQLFWKGWHEAFYKVPTFSLEVSVWRHRSLAFTLFEWFNNSCFHLLRQGRFSTQFTVDIRFPWNFVFQSGLWNSKSFFSFSEWHRAIFIDSTAFWSVIYCMWHIFPFSFCSIVSAFYKIFISNFLTTRLFYNLFKQNLILEIIHS